MMQPKIRIGAQKLAQIALLVAIEILLSRFCSIATPIVKIGFGFVPIALAGMLFGPWWAALAGGMPDFIGAILFPIGGYFPGFTLTAFAVGLVYGLFLHRRDAGTAHVLGAVGAVIIPLHLGLNTLWVSMISGSSFLALLPVRGVQMLVMAPVQFFLIRLLVTRKVGVLLGKASAGAK